MSVKLDPAQKNLVLAAMMGGSVVLILAAIIVMRRTLMQTHDCRIGEAGIYVRTLLRQETFVAWSSFLGSKQTGSVVSIYFRTPGGGGREVWLELPRGHEAEALRLRTFLEDRAGAKAAAEMFPLKIPRK